MQHGKSNNITRDQDSNIAGLGDSAIARDDSKTGFNRLNSETGAPSEDTKGVTLKINLVMVDKSQQATAILNQSSPNNSLAISNSREMTHRLQAFTQRLGGVGAVSTQELKQ